MEVALCGAFVPSLSIPHVPRGPPKQHCGTINTPCDLLLANHTDPRGDCYRSRLRVLRPFPPVWHAHCSETVQIRRPGLPQPGHVDSRMKIPCTIATKLHNLHSYLGVCFDGGDDDDGGVDDHGGGADASADVLVDVSAELPHCDPLVILDTHVTYLPFVLQAIAVWVRKVGKEI